MKEKKFKSKNLYTMLMRDLEFIKKKDMTKTT